ncbi:MAG: WYL domain-containing protein [Erysipelotrichia bacterium]|nr:WYL domain-containing protein [Erysipelotrichia bacterium]NCC54743.1 WYL domain-containing protein [Erysipelotrichia bacterium]
MADTRIYALAIYEILKNVSDEDHILSNSQIIQLLKTKYDIEVSQRTIINNVEALIQFGIDISTYLDNRKGYYLIDREFENSEIQLLCNCIHSAHYIPEKASSEMIDKLCAKQSKYKRKEFKNQVYIANYKKTKNKELLYNIELLNDAIKQRKIIEFQYLTYDFTKKLIPKREHNYAVHPYHIIQENDNLYLICKGINHTTLSHYRIDKMKNIKITQQAVDPLKKSFDPYVYAKGKKFMFSDDECKVTLYCHKRMLDDLIDQFGHDIMINPDVHDNNYFFASLNSSKQGIIYFAIQYLNFCEVIEPLDIRKQIVGMLKDRLAVYELKKN